MPIPVLWLCGPPGVGKTAVGLELYRQLGAADVAAAYVDIDQLGMCFPELPDDPDRHRLKARNLDAVIQCFAATGACCVVVSGVVESTAGLMTSELGHAELAVIRLRADPPVVARRFLARSVRHDLVDAVLREADQLDASVFADACVDTTDLDVSEVVRRVQHALGTWPSSRQGESSTEWPRPADAIEGRTVLFLHGPTGVGKSTIGFALFQRVLTTGSTAAYIDVDQLRFCPTATNAYQVRARALAAVWANFRACGAEVLVAVGTIGHAVAAETYAHALAASTTNWLHLVTEADELRDRILIRGEQGSWAEPGDELLGRPEHELLKIAKDAVAQTDAVIASGLRVDTTRLSVDELVDNILAQVDLV